MNTLAFGNLLAAYAGGEDITSLPADKAAAVVMAANQALDQWAQIIPPAWLQRPLGITLPAPRAITASATANSSTATVASIAAADLGRLCVVGGQVNRITYISSTTVTLLFPYTGTTGTVDFSIYGDAVTLDSQLVSIDTRPRLSTFCGLDAATAEESDEWHAPPSVPSGTPSKYAIRLANTSAGPRQLFCVDFAPPSATRVTAKATWAPTPLTIAALSIASTAWYDYVPPDHLSNIVFPLAVGKLSLMPVFVGDAKAAQAQAAAALLTASNLPAKFAHHFHLHGRPAGY